MHVGELWYIFDIKINSQAQGDFLFTESLQHCKKRVIMLPGWQQIYDEAS